MNTGNRGMERDHVYLVEVERFVDIGADQQDRKR